MGLMVGVDWGHEHVQFVAENEAGELVWHRRCPVKEVPKAIAHIRDLAGTGKVATAVELKAGRLVDQLLEGGFEVWFVRPAQVDQARSLRFASRAKDDLRDAKAMAWMLRSMRDGLIKVQAPDSRIVELRRLTRARDGAVGDRTAIRNTITSLFREVFPEMLALAKPDVKWFTTIWRLVRTPEGARDVGVAGIAAVLKKHRVRKYTAMQVHEQLGSGQMYTSVGDWTFDADRLLNRLELLEREVAMLEERIADRMQAIQRAEEQADEQGVSDVEIVRSLPGVADTISSVMIAERLPDLLMTDLGLTRGMTGVAPVRFTTGKQQTRQRGLIIMRRACNKYLRNALHLAVEKGLQSDPWMAARYASLRRRNHTHGRACRQVADSLLKRLRAMLRDRTFWSPPTAVEQAA